MEVYQDLVFPLLSHIDAETTHDRTIRLLELTQNASWGQRLLRQVAGNLPYRPVQLFGITFPNEIGVAAGFDKDVRVAFGLSQLGFGHIEVGTLTPKPQAGNRRPRIFRLQTDKALINRMGFPNCGVFVAGKRLKQISTVERKYVIGVSLGKQKETPIEAAANDYCQVMEEVYLAADYLAINVSSPNTPGLRTLQSEKYLEQLLLQLSEKNKELALRHAQVARPMLIKMAPDLSWSEVDTILAAATEKDINGIIATNTSLNRKGLSHANKAEKGGLSGTPLFERSLEMISYITGQLSGNLPVIGVGGVSSANDVTEMLAAGASLVQIYTSLIYQGPRLAGRILRAL